MLYALGEARGGSGCLDRKRAVVKCVELRCMENPIKPVRKTHQGALFASPHDPRPIRRAQNAFGVRLFHRYAAFSILPVPKYISSGV